VLSCTVEYKSCIHALSCTVEYKSYIHALSCTVEYIYVVFEKDMLTYKKYRRFISFLKSSFIIIFLIFYNTRQFHNDH